VRCRDRRTGACVSQQVALEYRLTSDRFVTGARTVAPYCRSDTTAWLDDDRRLPSEVYVDKQILLLNRIAYVRACESTVQPKFIFMKTELSFLHVS